MKKIQIIFAILLACLVVSPVSAAPKKYKKKKPTAKKITDLSCFKRTKTKLLQRGKDQTSTNFLLSPPTQSCASIQNAMNLPEKTVFTLKKKKNKTKPSGTTWTWDQIPGLLLNTICDLGNAS